MPEYLQIIITIAAGGLLCLLAVVVGAWINHKGAKSGTGDPFIGSPKGEAFTVDTGDGLDFPGDEPDKNEEHVLERASKFLKNLGGGA